MCSPEEATPLVGRVSKAGSAAAAILPGSHAQFVAEAGQNTVCAVAVSGDPAPTVTWRGPAGGRVGRAGR